MARDGDPAMMSLPAKAVVVVVTPSVLRQHRHNPGLMYEEILERGKEVYVA